MPPANDAKKEIKGEKQLFCGKKSKVADGRRGGSSPLRWGIKGGRLITRNQREKNRFWVFRKAPGDEKKIKGWLWADEKGKRVPPRQKRNIL